MKRLANVIEEGEALYLADHVPVSCFSGPPLPKEKTEDLKPKKEATKPKSPPGTFVLDMERSQALQRQEIKRKGVRKEISWKKDARKLRRKQKRR